MAQHHECNPRCTHQVVLLFDDLAVLAVIATKFLEPHGQVRGHLELSCRHQVEHHRNTGFGTVTTFRPGGVFGQHPQTLFLVLRSKGLTGTLASRTVLRPGDGDVGGDRLHRHCMLQRSVLCAFALQAHRRVDVDAAGVTIFQHEHGSERMTDAEVDPPNLVPVFGDGSDRWFLEAVFVEREDRTFASHRHAVETCLVLIDRILILELLDALRRHVRCVFHRHQDHLARRNLLETK